MQGRETAQQLWRFLYTYFTEEQELDNLLWVYSASQDLHLDWFPGLAYADVLGVDIYRAGQQAERTYYDQLTAIAGGKPVVLSECDLIPDVDVLQARGFAWGWVTTWHGRYVRKNSPESLKRFYTSDRVVTRDELPDFHHPDASWVSPEEPVPGTGERSASALIIDSQGRALHLTFDAPPPAAATDRWFQRMEAYDKDYAIARARDEALRREWIANERERAEQEAARQAEEQAWARQAPTYGTAYWLGGGGGRRHDRPSSRGRQRSSTRAEVSPLSPIFLPTPNLTSPFPRSQPKPPPASNKSFLP